MPFFSSKRERWLWLLTLVVVTAIYATLGRVQQLLGLIEDERLIGAAFWLGLLLVGTAVLTQGLSVRPHGLEIGVFLGIAGAYLIVFLRLTILAERSHLIEYSVVALLIHEALKERAAQGRHVPKPTLLALIITILLGWIDEGIQAILPNRVYDLRDVGFNALAALLAIGGSVVLSRARQFALSLKK